ncbi:hypothetical protein SAMN02745135_01281 [Caloranaerobacter azorensis DSM 13643]|uniref:Uncharacterized protein n=1 Tax=Caloranaerobacter azorensis DSM 13643 TaxID=1121264 RepID=A0A1M5U6M6_9FIRM|nr:hypothetical protein [Caloranaerobacter azorensis]SHH58506.1 hypothetical protein SAMN02745135_01281 [Caloranaerobacter azorensis DSM 13643]
MICIGYKKNAHVYYDIQKECINIVKRRKRYQINGNVEDYELIQKIIELAFDGIFIDELIKNIPNKREDILKFVKMLLKLDILYIVSNRQYRFDRDFQQYVIKNFKNHYEILDYLEQKTFIFINAPASVIDFFTDRKIKVVNIDGKDIIENNLIDGILIYFGIDENLIEKFLKRFDEIILVNEVNYQYLLLYLTGFNKSIINTFKKFEMNNVKDYGMSSKILPINILLHYIENKFDFNKVNTRLIYGDGAINTFNIDDLARTYSTEYYERTFMDKLTNLEIIQNFEIIQKEIPHIITNINNYNKFRIHSPITSYLIEFSSVDGKIEYISFHEKYEMAAINAITNGLSKFLNTIEKRNGYKWVCKTSKDEYLLFGLISMLPSTDEVYKIETSERVNLVIDYIKEVIGIDVEVLGQNIFQYEVVKIMICDKNSGYVIFESDRTVDQEETILEGLYHIIGNYQNGIKKHEDKRCVLDNLNTIKIKNVNKKTLKENIQNFLNERQILIKEEIWCYQNIFEKAQLYIGCFSRLGDSNEKTIKN